MFTEEKETRLDVAVGQAKHPMAPNICDSLANEKSQFIKKKIKHFIYRLN